MEDGSVRPANEAAPDRQPLDAYALRAVLGARWARIQVVASTASTNADLLADEAAPDRSVLVAEDQVAGRGRLDRQWVTPARAGLTFSVLLRPTTPIPTWGWLPLLAGVAVHEAVGELVPASLKWPNDVLCGSGDRKLAGVLAQTSGAAVVIGIGLNVSTTAAELPVDTATSLAQCGATELNRTMLLIRLLTRFGALVARWSDVGGDAEASGLAAAYRSACATLGRDVAVTTTAGSRLVGRAVTIESDGRLRLDTGDIVGAGDVEHLRGAR